MAQTAAASNNGLSKIDVAEIRSRLLGLRTDLLARGSERDLLDLKRVETALDKLQRGGYGACESCARAMQKNRLISTPHARYCEVCSGGRGFSGPPRRAPQVRSAS
jgi:RNA polymerase-binding transcription factor DksA